MDERIINIAKSNSYYDIDRKLHEEIGELMQAKSKLDEHECTQNIESIYIKSHEELTKHVAEEIADVQIMLQQIIFILGIHDEVEFQTNYKLDRQIKRIEQKEKEGRKE